MTVARDLFNFTSIKCGKKNKLELDFCNFSDTCTYTVTLLKVTSPQIKSLGIKYSSGVDKCWDGYGKCSRSNLSATQRNKIYFVVAVNLASAPVQNENIFLDKLM